MALDHGPVFHLQACSEPASKLVVLLLSFPAHSLLLGHLTDFFFFLIPEDLLPLHDQALPGQATVFLLIQLQHLFLLGMVKAFIAYTRSSLNPISSVVILSKKQCLSHILKWTKSVSIAVTASGLNSDLG